MLVEPYPTDKPFDALLGYVPELSSELICLALLRI